MDWLLPLQPRIEQQLAKRHLSDRALVLYDLTSTYFEGRPVAVEVFAGYTAEPKTVATRANKLRQRFALQQELQLADRGHCHGAVRERCGPESRLDGSTIDDGWRPDQPLAALRFLRMEAWARQKAWSPPSPELRLYIPFQAAPANAAYVAGCSRRDEAHPSRRDSPAPQRAL